VKGILLLILLLALPLQAHEDHDHNAPNPPDKNDVLNLIRTGDVDALHKLIQKDPKVAQTPIAINTNTTGPPLHASAISGQDGIVKLLLEQGVPVDALDSNGDTAINLAMRLKLRKRKGNFDGVIQTLITKGATIDLPIALGLGDVERVREIVKQSWQIIKSDHATLFDGTTLNGWRPLTDGWQVNNGEIISPTSKSVQYMVHENLIDQPFELSCEVTFLERKRGDGKVVGIMDAGGNYAWVCLDDQNPNTMQLASGRKFFDAVGVHGRWTPKNQVPLKPPMKEWYNVVCRVDGSKFSVSCKDKELDTPFTPQFPVFIWLEVQRTGAKFKAISISKL